MSRFASVLAPLLVLLTAGYPWPTDRAKGSALKTIDPVLDEVYTSLSLAR